METYYSIQRFSDANEHGRNIVNLAQDYFQIEKGRFESTLRQFDLDGVHVFTESANCNMVQCGGVLPDAVIFAWAIMPAAASSARHRYRAGAVATGFKRGGEDWMYRVAGQTEVGGVTMPAAEFDRLAEPLGLDGKGNVSGHVRLMQDSQAFSAVCTAIGELGCHTGHLGCVQVRASLRTQIIDGIFCALRESERVERPNLTRLTYNDIVKRSQELVLRTPEHPPSVLDLCISLRVCRRTLQKSFMHVMGMSPSSYIRSIRLGGVRRLLRSVPAHQMSIGEAAARWGFFHLGNFSHDYRQLFGELPSQTVRLVVG